jgi:hypothetical protein
MPQKPQFVINYFFIFQLFRPHESPFVRRKRTRQRKAGYPDTYALIRTFSSLFSLQPGCEHRELSCARSWAASLRNLGAGCRFPAAEPSFRVASANPSSSVCSDPNHKMLCRKAKVRLPKADVKTFFFFKSFNQLRRCFSALREVVLHDRFRASIQVNPRPKNLKPSLKSVVCYTLDSPIFLRMPCPFRISVLLRAERSFP